MQIYPEKYDKLELSTSERSFLRTMERSFPGDQLAYYVLQINPRKRDAGKGQAELFSMLVVPEGILLLRFFDSDIPLVITTTIKAMGNPMVFRVLENDIIAKLEESNYLVRENGILRYALNISFVFPNIERSQIETELTDIEKDFCDKHILFKNDIQILRKEGKALLLKRFHPADEITEDKVNNIFQRLCPEITIPRKFILDDRASISIKEAALTQIDRAVQSYRLDTWQIDIVNRINRGNQLILACAGSGKSVLLIAKCFKLASLNPSENFLLTCYNRNLNNYYQWAISQAGFTDRNVRCTTFLGLCRQLLESNGLSLPTRYFELLEKLKAWASGVSKTIRHLSYERSLTTPKKAIAEAEKIDDLDDENALYSENYGFAEDYSESSFIDQSESDELAETDFFSKLGLLTGQKKAQTKYAALNINDKLTMEQRRILERVFDLITSEYDQLTAESFVNTISKKF